MGTRETEAAVPLRRCRTIGRNVKASLEIPKAAGAAVILITADQCGPARLAASESLG